MTERVARDGDTVTVRCAMQPATDWLAVSPSAGVADAFRVELYQQSFDVDDIMIVLYRADLAAFCHEGLALTGEPDWKALAVKLNRLWRADQARYGEAIRGRLAQATADRLHAAQDAITAAEWAAVEGAGDE